MRSGFGTITDVKKALKVILVVLAVIAVTVIALVPFVVPPIATSLAESSLRQIGYPARIRMTLGYRWRKGPEIAGAVEVALRIAPWRLTAEFGAGFGEWFARVKLPETKFSESDPLIASLLERYPTTAVSNLVFSGSVALDASVERTREVPVATWAAKAPIRGVNASLFAGKTPITVTDLSLTPGASGIASHVDIAPLFPRAKEIVAAGFSLTNFHAAVRATEKALMVNDAEAGFCGGKVSLYSLYLDPRTLNTGLTLFLEDIDAGAALGHFKGFRGDASGHLHGKIRLFTKEAGKSVRLKDAFLYSTPGETGKLRLDDTKAVTDSLTLAGIDAATRGNVANALADLDYSVLKLDLRRGSGQTATLSISIRGTATRGELTVPVDIDVNLNGELDQLLNTGLGYNRLLKKGTMK